MAKVTKKKAAVKKTTAKTTAAKKPAAKTAAKTTAKKATAVKKTITVKKTAKKTKVKFPEKFTATSMVNYLAEKHELTKIQAKEIFESMFDVINAGVMGGARVPVGKFGKIYVKIRPARKARKGRNPLTGEEITIPAKRATKVPKFTFSKTFKEDSSKAKVKK